MSPVHQHNFYALAHRVPMGSVNVLIHTLGGERAPQLTRWDAEVDERLNFEDLPSSM